jgi:Uma2 family endonuclease
MTVSEMYQDSITLPRAVRFPVELRPPEGFSSTRLETWPRPPGRLEYVDGRLLYMPPCGDRQQDTVTDVVITLGAWTRSHPEFVLGTNEAGMHLLGATRAADAAIWRRSDLGRYTGRLRHVAPLLAVEVCGEDEPEPLIREKALWYLRAGVAVVWVVIPETRDVVVVTAGAESRYRTGQRLPPHPGLPGLAPEVSELFSQIAAP